MAQARCRCCPGTSGIGVGCVWLFTYKSRCPIYAHLGQIQRWCRILPNKGVHFAPIKSSYIHSKDMVTYGDTHPIYFDFRSKGPVIDHLDQISEPIWRQFFDLRLFFSRMPALIEVKPRQWLAMDGHSFSMDGPHGPPPVPDSGAPQRTGGGSLELTPWTMRSCATGPRAGYSWGTQIGRLQPSKTGGWTAINDRERDATTDITD